MEEVVVRISKEGTGNGGIRNHRAWCSLNIYISSANPFRVIFIKKMSAEKPVGGRKKLLHTLLKPYQVLDSLRSLELKGELERMW